MIPGFAARLGRQALRLAQPLVRPRSHGLRILAYHLVSGGTDSAVDLDIGSFARQMDLVARLTVPVTLSAGTERLRVGEPNLMVAVTFDDAFANFREVAWPICLERQIPVTLYVPVGFVLGEQPSPLEGAALPALSLEDIRSMQETGLLEVGSHTWTHPDLRSTSLDLKHEIVDAASLLRSELGSSVSSFCYPRARRSADAESMVRSCHRFAVVGGGAIASPRTPHHRLQRLSLRRDHSLSVRTLNSAIVLEEALANQVRQLR